MRPPQKLTKARKCDPGHAQQISHLQKLLCKCDAPPQETSRKSYAQTHKSKHPNRQKCDPILANARSLPRRPMSQSWPFLCKCDGCISDLLIANARKPEPTDTILAKINPKLSRALETPSNHTNKYINLIRTRSRARIIKITYKTMNRIPKRIKKHSETLELPKPQPSIWFLLKQLEITPNFSHKF